MEQIAIKEVRVEALHDQYDVDIQLQRELNVIYGKNGRGKTTLLHILANALEMDFERFKHIQFRSIDIQTYQGGHVRIVPDSSFMLIEVDDQRLTPIGNGSTLSEAESHLLRQTLGSRAVYLPAFRAILERSPADSYMDPEKRAEIDLIRASELAISRENQHRAIAYETRNRSEQHRFTAAKTVLCRQWFGMFVPVVRYPSLADVRSRLNEEVREATFDISIFEQRLFSQLFIQVFNAIAGKGAPAPPDKTDALLAQVHRALVSIEASSGGASNVYGEIRDLVEEASQSHMASEGATSQILSIYADLLEQRSNQHQKAFSKIRDFERSINLFLDGKRFTLDDSIERGIRGPAVLSANGRPMNLSALSSGERQVLTMIFCASRLAENRGIFLVDEPELSLHIDWQRSILGEVMRQAEGRQVIACTHSPEVGADHYDSVQDFSPLLSQAPKTDLFGDGFEIPEDL